MLIDSKVLEQHFVCHEKFDNSHLLFVNNDYILLLYTYANEDNAMLLGSVFVNNKTQSVRLPVEARFDEQVKKVSIRTLGKERILCPVENTWDSFFLGGEAVTDDFLTERAEQTESEREAF